MACYKIIENPSLYIVKDECLKKASEPKALSKWSSEALKSKHCLSDSEFGCFSFVPNIYSFCFKPRFLFLFINEKENRNHGVCQSMFAYVSTGDINFSTFAAGMVASAASSGGQLAGGFLATGNGMMATGFVSGGLAASITGGNFWAGAVTGLTVAALNHTMHQSSGPGDDPYEGHQNEITQFDKVTVNGYRQSPTMIAIKAIGANILKTITSMNDYKITDSANHKISQIGLANDVKGAMFQLANAGAQTGKMLGHYSTAMKGVGAVTGFMTTRDSLGKISDSYQKGGWGNIKTEDKIGLGMGVLSLVTTFAKISGPLGWIIVGGQLGYGIYGLSH